MKKVIIGLFGTLILLAGLALVCYPFISNYLMGLNHASEISEQQDAVAKTDDATILKALEDAEMYNKNLLGNVVLTDPFDPNFIQKIDLEYENLLNINNDSIMGDINIPKINVRIPIFHGTSQDVLEKGVGHLPNTSLPVGGKSTHAVLTGHTGISNAALFTDLDKLVIGDVFFIQVLNRTLAYKVDQIKVVLPTETKDLVIVDDQDYVTLITCTPYGINSHRLLVRGTRVPVSEAMTELSDMTEPVESTWMSEYKRALIIGGIVLASVIIIFIIIRIFLSIRRKKMEKKKG